MRVAAPTTLLVALVLAVWTAPAVARASELEWTRLPDLPDPVGVAGPFAGRHGDVLIVAGGANFPPPAWESEKAWHANVWVLDLAAPEPAWRAADPLPAPRAYGACASTSRGVVCAGGNDARDVHADAFLLRWDAEQERLAREPLPPLPVPLVHAAACAVGDTVYVLGGQTTAELASAVRDVYALDLAAQPPEWRRLALVPEPARAFAVAAAQHDGTATRVYLAGGRHAREGGAPHFLTDVHALDTGGGSADLPGTWRRRADLPRAVAAGTAAAFGESSLFVLGGDDGRFAGREDELRDEHPGFPKEALVYNTITDRWASAGPTPVNQVTTWAVAHSSGLIVPTGEVRPRARTSEVWSARPAQRSAEFGLVNGLVLALYLAGMLGVGVYFSRSNKSADDFFRGGQRIPGWAAGLSIFATMLSSITFMAIPAKAFATDWLYATANGTLLLITPIVIACFLPFYRRIDATSVYEYLERRFDVRVRLFASALFVLFHVARMAVVQLLAALALSTLLPISVEACIAAMGLLALVYCALGGIRAVIWTDVLQTFVLLGGAAVSLVVIYLRLDAPGEALSGAAAEGKLRFLQHGWDPTAPTVWVVVVGYSLTNFVWYASDQAVVQRYMTTSTERKAARAIWLNAWLGIASTVLFFALGTALWLFYRDRPERLDPTFPTDAVLPLFIARELPVGLGGLVVAGLFAAAQSTVSTSLNSLSTVLVTDFYRRFRPREAERKYLALARGLTVVLGVVGTAVALGVAMTGERSLLDTFLRYLGLATGALGGLFALGIFTRRANARGALVGAVTGALTLYFVQTLTDLHFFLYTGIGVAAAVVIGYAASLSSPAPRRDLDGLTWTWRRRSASASPAARDVR